MKNKSVILVSGMSGAGKSSVTRILEDMGYHIIDNYPVQLMSFLADMIESSIDPRYEKVALSTTAQDFPTFLRLFRGADIRLQILFLDAQDSILLKRYKSTRRIHPLLLSNSANTLEEAISMERQTFQQYRSPDVITMDTSFTTEKELRAKLEKYFLTSKKQGFSISFISFGYKYGLPMDADLVFDVRFLPNPFWEVSLRGFSGNDENVYTYVMEKEETKEFLQYLMTYCDYVFGKYREEGKNHLTVGIGCTGGQHRSVTITNYLFDVYKEKYHCYKEHRDEKEWFHE
ncbi:MULTISPECIES: RNase adapter RapZ [Terrabacteria group]|uniref:RNase adapter RapZ n=1 Tax=Bacillati TaxID=1783272 RepID=UPI001C6F58DA|nr:MULTISPECIES: RNase adapter RapZ [Terrabacteria group]MBW9212459.1 RNase adapter RapZ [Trueperella sp. zg.1013]